jgi:hypothetical protein
MSQHLPLAELEKLKTRIQALRAKTIANGCTEDEALSAAAKVAELLDRHDLSLSDVELREGRCEELGYRSPRKKRIPLDECIGAIADFCDCKVWRERDPDGEVRHVFFGLPSDVVGAHALAELVDAAVRSELGRYKTTRDYGRLRHQDRYLANASFVLGMVASIADKLTAMKAERDKVNRGTGRDLIVLKHGIVDAELARLGLDLRVVEGEAIGRMVLPDAYEAGSEAGAALGIDRPIAGRPRRLRGDEPR